MTYNRYLRQGQARQAAVNFGNAQLLLAAGHAFGQNIVTGFGDVPTLDLASVYVQMAGIEAAFLMDATSYAWDSNGLVVSSDLLLLGATGFYGASAPASSWVRLPVPSGGLNASPVPVNGVAAKANSIAIPAGFNPANPASVAAALALLPTNGSDTYSKSQSDDVGLIGPALEIELLEIGTGPVLEVIEYGYALTLPAEAFTLATGGVAVVVDGVHVPAAAVTVAALAPVVAVGAVVQVPAGVVAVQGLAPAVGIGVVVQVPVGAVTVAALELALGIGVAVQVPAGEVTVAALEPAVVAEAPPAPAGGDELAFWGWQQPEVLLFAETVAAAEEDRGLWVAWDWQLEN